MLLKLTAVRILFIFLILIFVIILTRNMYSCWQKYEYLNPVLSSPSDITSDLLQRIIDNSIESLTIRYQFTRCKNQNEIWDDWIGFQNRNNPFWKANKINMLKRIECT